MKLPLRTESWADVAVGDDGIEVDIEEIFAALDNAAAGPWEKGPVPDGEKEGDLLLLLGELPEDTELLMWRGGAWNVSYGDCWEPIDTEQISPESWAHINFLKQQEATK